MEKEIYKELFEVLNNEDARGGRYLFVGGMNRDIQCQSHAEVIKGDSNPGEVVFSAGGVARNMAENAARLGVRSSLFALAGDDNTGRVLIAETEAAGVDVSPCRILSHKRSCIYSAFLNQQGEMLYAVNDMSLMNDFVPSLFQDFDFSGFDGIVIDSNLPEDTISFLGESGKVLLADCVSVHKAVRLKKSLNHITAIKPNRAEAEILCGFPLKQESDFYRACDVLHKNGCSKVFISAGAEGIYYSDAEGRGRAAQKVLHTASVTGAGDCAGAAMVLALARELTARHAAVLANLAAAEALKSSSAVNKSMNLNRLKEKCLDLGRER